MPSQVLAIIPALLAVSRLVYREAIDVLLVNLVAQFASQVEESPPLSGWLHGQLCVC